MSGKVGACKSSWRAVHHGVTRLWPTNNKKMESHTRHSVDREHAGDTYLARWHIEVADNDHGISIRRHALQHSNGGLGLPLTQQVVPRVADK